MLLRPKTRTLKSFALRALVPRTVVFGVGATILALGHAIAVNPTAHSESLPTEPSVEAPAWTAADITAYPGCIPSAAWPSGTPAEFVVVHSFREDSHQKVAFDLAWRLNHDDTEVDDVWVVGVCGHP